MSRDTSLYLKDIVEACDRVTEHVAGRTREQALDDPKTRDAIFWNLMVIGEAAKRVPDDVRACDRSIEWRKIAGLRDVLAHGYFGIDEDIVWDVIENKIAPLRTAVAGILAGV